MAKKKRTDKTHSELPSFEETLQRLESIIHQLEDGRIGLSESLSLYEEAVAQLKQCHLQLDEAESRVSLLSGFDRDGNPVTQPLCDETEAAETLQQKADSRGRRRSHAESAGAETPVDSTNAMDAEPRDVDLDNTLF